MESFMIVLQIHKLVEREKTPIHHPTHPLRQRYKWKCSLTEPNLSAKSITPFCKLVVWKANACHLCDKAISTKQQASSFFPL